MTQLLKDFRGLTLGKGDLIAYPGRRGASMWMNTGTVVELQPHTFSLLVESYPTGRRVRISALERVAVLGRN